MKKVAYNKLSDRHCAACGKNLKQNLVNRKPGQTLVCFSCYQDYMNQTENRVRTAREIRVKPHLRSVQRRHVPLRRSMAV